MTECPQCGDPLDIRSGRVSVDIGACPGCGHSWLVRSQPVAPDGGEQR